MNVDELPLRSEIIDLLLGASFHSLSDFEQVTATGLTEELEISLDEAIDILETVERCSNDIAPSPRNGFDNGHEMNEKEDHDFYAGSMNGFKSKDHIDSVPMSAMENDIDMTDIHAAGTNVSRNKNENVRDTNQSESGNHYVFRPINAWELFEQEKNRRYIVTSCAEMDDMLGGGVETGKITEFCGDNEAGKSQISMQLLVNVQIPRHFGGLEGRAVYIVTDASFSVERLASIAKGLVKQLNDVNAEKSPEGQYPNMDQFTVEHILSNIQVVHCLDHIELIAVSHQLPDQIRSLGQVNLIIVENIANPFRCEFASLALRGRILSELAQRFLKIAYEHDLAVVFTNQMTTTRAGKLLPCLGQYWGHSCSNRVILAREGKYRMAHLKKSSWKKETTVSYIITEEGVRSAPEPVQCRLGSSSCMMRFDDTFMRYCASL